MLTDIVAERFGEKVLRMYDPDGMPVELIETPSAPVGNIGVFRCPTLASTESRSDGALPDRDHGLPAGGPQRQADSVRSRGWRARAILDMCAVPPPEAGLGGAGTVHHIAWRSPTMKASGQWRDKLAESGH